MRVFSFALLPPAAAQLVLPGLLPADVLLPGLPPTAEGHSPVELPAGWPAQPDPNVPAPDPHVVERTGFCEDANERQASGYLSAGTDVSYFFWLVRSEAKGPKPLLLWLSGGPGCSSSLALLLENGPCQADGQNANGGWKLKKNPHSWTKIADVMWVDQPSNVGYSAGRGISMNEDDVGKHMFTFLQNFFLRFPDLRSSPFYVTGESFGGHYLPAVATSLLREIKNGTNPPLRLDGVAIGNGLVDPLIQFTTAPEMLYTGGTGGSLGHGVISKDEYEEMESQMPLCKNKLLECRASRDWSDDCGPAMMDCMEPTIVPLTEKGLNPYDLRKQCPPSLRPLCVNITDTINFMNDPAVQDALGVKPHRAWLPCSMYAGLPFQVSGDSLQSTAPLVAELLAGGVPVLAYYGDTDFMCHWVGGKDWAMQLEWPQKQAWAAAEDRPWTVDGVQHGKHRSLGGFTFLQVFNSGHLVPADQPAAALSMMNTFMTKGEVWDMPDMPAATRLNVKQAVAGATALGTSLVAFAVCAAMRFRRQGEATKPDGEIYLLLS